MSAIQPCKYFYYAQNRRCSFDTAAQRHSTRLTVVILSSNCQIKRSNFNFTIFVENVLFNVLQHCTVQFLQLARWRYLKTGSVDKWPGWCCVCFGHKVLVKRLFASAGLKRCIFFTFSSLFSAVENNFSPSILSLQPRFRCILVLWSDSNPTKSDIGARLVLSTFLQLCGNVGSRGYVHCTLCRIQFMLN